MTSRCSTTARPRAIISALAISTWRPFLFAYSLILSFRCFGMRVVVFSIPLVAGSLLGVGVFAIIWALSLVLVHLRIVPAAIDTPFYGYLQIF